ncbi:MAG: hypothetical protein NTY09_10040, partial [bacterium]|nr:hypothetical protein [bacterium]
MNRAVIFLVVILAAMTLMYGCGGDTSQPIMPDEAVSPAEPTGNADVPTSTDGNSHSLLAYNFIYIDPE